MKEIIDKYYKKSKKMKINKLNNFSISKYKKIIIKSKLTPFLISILFIPLLIPLIFLRLLGYRFIRINDNRIGHLAGDTDLFLRRLKLNNSDNNKYKYVGVSSTKPCNKPLLKMFKRVIPIIQIPMPGPLNMVFKIISSNSIFSKLGIINKLDHFVNQSYPFDNINKNLFFSKKEEKRGEKLIKDMNVKNWFICFHSRDSLYVNKHIGSHEDDHLNYRNCKNENYLKGAEYITQQGGYALRMGALVKKKINIKNVKIIDYAVNYRTEFGDIYLPAKCKFFLGSPCGINQIAQIFDVPVAWANVVLLKYPPSSKRDLFILKKIWSTKERRFLTFKEIINKGIINYDLSHHYTNNDLILIENTSEEILDLTIEMNERLDGTWKITEEDEYLQNKLKLLYEGHIFKLSPRMGSKFLRENKYLLE